MSGQSVGRRQSQSNVISIDQRRRKRTVQSNRTEKKPDKRVRFGYDFSVLFVVFTLVLFGVLMVFSSSYYKAMVTTKFSNDMYYFLKRQGLWAIIGTFAMILTMNFDYKRLRYFAWIGYIVVNALLVVVFSVEAINGSKRWLDLGAVGVQPSELAKIMMIVFLPTLISKDRSRLNTYGGFMYFNVLIMIPVILIGIQNFSTALVVAFISYSILFVASPKIWHFLTLVLPAAVLGTAGILLQGYRSDRFIAWLDPFSDPLDKGFQVVQSLFAIASGGLFGLGLGQSRQKDFIPEAYNDIIFSVICEELGLFGATMLLMLFTFLIWRGIKIAVNSQDLLGSLIACGVVAMIAVQVLINVAVNTNTIPVTGMALPFISYGGSSLLTLMVSSGVLLSVSRYSKI